MCVKILAREVLYSGRLRLKHLNKECLAQCMVNLILFSVKMKAERLSAFQLSLNLELQFDVTAFYPRDWNACQEWRCDLTACKAVVYLIYDLKTFFSGKLDLSLFPFFFFNYRSIFQFRWKHSDTVGGKNWRDDF